MSDAYDDIVHHLAKKLCVAVHIDELSDDGCDIGAGFLGTEVSNFVRETALTMHQQQKEIDKLDRQLNTVLSRLQSSDKENFFNQLDNVTLNHHIDVLRDALSKVHQELLDAGEGDFFASNAKLCADALWVTRREN